MIIFVGGKAFVVRPLNGAQWGYSIVLGALSLPVAVIIRLIPDHWIAALIPHVWRKRLVPELVAKENALRRRGSRPEDLSFIKSIRGGRVHSMKWKIQDELHNAKVHANEKIHEKMIATGVKH